MHEWQVWFVAALLLFVAEMIAPGFWLLSVAVGSIAAGVVSLVLAGRVGIVSERIDPGTGKGRVVVEGEDWRAAALMDAPLEPGTRVMVVRVEGATLYVDKES